MNQSLLPKFNSTANLTTRIQDLYNTFVFPTILLLGLIFNSLSIWVSLKINEKKNLKDFNMCEYMFCNGVIDLIICFLSIFLPIIRGGVYFEYCYSFASKIYEQYLYLYLDNAFILCSALIESWFTLDRLMSFDVKKTQEKNRISFKIKCLIFLIIALVACLPNYIISRNIMPIGILVTQDNLVLYSVSNNSIGNNIYCKIVLFIVTLFRGFFIYTLILVLNIIIAYKLKKHMSKKMKLNSNSSHQRNQQTTNNKYTRKNNKRNKQNEKVNKMLLIISTFYLITHLPYSFTAILFFIGLNNTIYSYVLLFTNTLLFTSHSSFFFVYFFNNPKFRNKFLELSGVFSYRYKKPKQESSSQVRSLTTIRYSIHEKKIIRDH